MSDDDGRAESIARIARDFAERHQNKLRFDRDSGAWFIWTGSAWRQDRMREVFDDARTFCRAMEGEPSAEGRLCAMGKPSTVTAVLRMAEADPRLAFPAH